MLEIIAVSVVIMTIANVAIDISVYRRDRKLLEISTRQEARSEVYYKKEIEKQERSKILDDMMIERFKSGTFNIRWENNK